MEQDQNEYRDNLIECIKTLIGFERLLFPAAINVLMKGEFKEIDEVFEIDDTYDFNINHLKLSNDVNVQKLSKVIKKIRRTSRFLIAVNKITDYELEV